MGKVKIAIVYYSSTGTNYKLSQWAESSLTEAGAEVRLRKAPETAPQSAIESNPAWAKHIENTKDVKEVSMDDLDWADGIIFSVPTRYGNVPAQIKQVLDSTGPLWQKGKLMNKVVSGMTSAMNDHGGQEATLLSLYTTMYHWGAIVVAPGYGDDAVFAAGGNPYGTSVSVDQEGNLSPKEDTLKPAVEYQAKRVMDIASKLGKS